VNGSSLQRGPLQVVHGASSKKAEIVVGPRVGITQAVDWPLRFYLKGSPWVSR
jgi:DNA-3-methyladenine glycosylase